MLPGPARPGARVENDEIERGAAQIIAGPGLPAANHDDIADFAQRPFPSALRRVTPTR